MSLGILSRHTRLNSHKRWLEDKDFGFRKYYLCSKSKVADQLHGYQATDLCLCFHKCKKRGCGGLVVERQLLEREVPSSNPTVAV